MWEKFRSFIAGAESSIDQCLLFVPCFDGDIYELPSVGMRPVSTKYVQMVKGQGHL